VDQRETTIIAIGDEVLYGYTENSNSSSIAKELVQRGVIPTAHRVVSDDPEELSKILQEELEKGRDVITTGGLGPTIDDHTKSVVSKLFHQKLIHNDSLFKALQGRYGADFATLKEQSLQPEKAIFFYNNVGTAPGLFLEDSSLFPNARLFVLPGPPQEMQVVLTQILEQFFSGSPLPFHAMCFIDVAEHVVNACVQEIKKEWPHVQIGIYPSFSMVRVHLYVEKESDKEALEQAQKQLSSKFHNKALPYPSLETTIHELLQQKGYSMATAESCTAGGIAARIASVDGASTTFAGSVVAYRNEVKEKVLSVPKETLDTFGAVSEEVTLSMAQGVQTLFKTDVACAVSGFLGPTGGTEKAPVGTVCTTILLPNKTHSETFVFHGTRSAICEKSIQSVLMRLASLLLES